MRTVGIWDVTSGKPERLQHGVVVLESELEAWIEQDPALLQSGLTIIGRQVHVESGYIDLLGIDLNGNWVLIELKRGDVRRETVAQALDYAASLLDMSINDIEHAVGRYLDVPLQQAAHQLGISIEKPNRQNIAVYIAGTGRDPNLERIVQFFSSDFQFNVVTFEVFQGAQGLRYVVRELTELDLRPAELPTTAVATISVETLRHRAHTAGLGTQFDLLYEAGIRHGMYPRLYKTSVMFAPSAFKSRMGYTFWIKPYGGKMVCWVSPATFAEFYPVSEQQARNSLALDEDTKMLLDEVDARSFANRLDDLFTWINAAQEE